MLLHLPSILPARSAAVAAPLSQLVLFVTRLANAAATMHYLPGCYLSFWTIASFVKHTDIMPSSPISGTQPDHVVPEIAARGPRGRPVASRCANPSIGKWYQKGRH